MTSRPEIAARLAAATPDFTPMRYDHGGGRAYVEGDAKGKGRKLVIDCYQEEDTEFYFNAREDVAFLLREIAELEAKVAGLNEHNNQLWRMREETFRDAEAKVAGLEKLLDRARKIISDMSPGHYIHEEISAALAGASDTGDAGDAG